MAKFYPHYTPKTTEFSKCIKFENGLRADIKRAIGYQKIRNFSELVSSCRIYEEDKKAHYKAMNERKGKGQQSRPKPYSAPADKGKQRLNDERRPRKQDATTIENQEANNLGQMDSGYKVSKDQQQEPIEIKNKRSSNDTLLEKNLKPKHGGIGTSQRHSQGTNLIKILVINNLTHWRKPIVTYLENPDGTTCRKIKYRSLSYVLISGDLFKKIPEGVLLRCLGETEAYLAVSNTHSHACGTHQTGHKMKWLFFSTRRVLANYAEKLHRIRQRLSGVPKTC